MSAPALVRPFADAFAGLWEAGWRGVLPLPPGKKFPPPRGTTGYGAPLPSFADLWSWAEQRPDANVALRMAPGQVAIDVDAYGDKPGAATIAEQARRAGVALPATWRLSSRGVDNLSGRYLLRVPEGTRLVTALPGVEMVQPHHRYSVAAPSRNDADSGRPVEWIDPGGRVSARVPSPSELPELPAAWVELLAADGPRVEPMAVAGGEYAEWVRGLEPGPPCVAVRRRLDAAESDARGRSGASRHEATREHVLAILRLGEMGHHGVREALAGLRQVYVRAVADRAGPDVAAAEFDRMRRPEAVGLLLATATPEHRQQCICPEGIARLLDSISDPELRAEAEQLLGSRRCA